MNIFKSVLLESKVLLGRIRGYGSCGEAKRRQKYHTTAQTTDDKKKTVGNLVFHFSELHKSKF